MSASIGTDNYRIAVIGVSGEHLMWADDARARELVKLGQARPIRRKGRDRVLQAVAGWKKPGEVNLSGRGTALDRTRYSHRRETEDNPQNVWTLVRLGASTRPIFVQVLEECLRPA
jgi:hypothetical protein